MREVLAEVQSWRKQGKQIAIATNVRRDGTSLRPLGAKMAVTNTQPQEISGSVTGGCIEGVVYEEAQAVIKNGSPKLLRYGIVSEETPWEVGLTCGSSLEVFVESLESDGWREIFSAVENCLETNELAAVATVISGPGLGRKLMCWPDGRRLGGMGSPELDAQVQAWVLGQLAVQEDTWAAFAVGAEKVEVFVDVFVPAARLIVVGAVHIAIPLVALAKILGYYTIVIDPRSAFATAERFPASLVDELLHEWPSTALERLHLDAGTYVAVLSHDEKLDNPALKVALTSPARYVGVLGTRKKLPQRYAALRELGVTDEQISRLRAPIGMNLGAVLPDEIALSILSEMVSARHGLPMTQEHHLTLPVSAVS